MLRHLTVFLRRLGDQTQAGHGPHDGLELNQEQERREQ
jgi:hypothetical protein